MGIEPGYRLNSGRGPTTARAKMFVEFPPRLLNRLENSSTSSLLKIVELSSAAKCHFLASQFRKKAESFYKGEKIDLSTVLMNLHNIFLGEVIYKSWYKLSISI